MGPPDFGGIRLSAGNSTYSITSEDSTPQYGAGGCCAAGFQSRHCRLGVRPGRTQTAHIESASTPRADMKRTFRIGSFVPNSDIGQIIDHLVGAREQASAGLQGRQLTPWAIDEQLEIGGL